MSVIATLPPTFKRLTAGQKRRLVLACEGCTEPTPMRFKCPATGATLHSVHTTFTALFPRERVRIHALGPGTFGVLTHTIGMHPSFDAAHGDVGFACPADYAYFGTASATAQFAAAAVAAISARLEATGPCKVATTFAENGTVAAYFYTPDAWARAHKERLFPAYAWHNAELAQHFLTYAEQLEKNPLVPPTAVRYNREQAEKLGGYRPALLAAAAAARNGEQA